MDHTPAGELSDRDRALLRAVAAGHAEVVDHCGPLLSIDGRGSCDQFAASRLTLAGLLQPPRGRSRTPARLTPAGRAALARA